jgi:uncharacterized protein YkwD
MPRIWPMGAHEAFHTRVWRVLMSLLLVLGLSQLGIPPASAEPVALANEMTQAVNQVRLEVGLQSLTTNTVLEELALERSTDMLVRDYFSHTTPDGVSFSSLIERRGVTYQTAGENLAVNAGCGSQAGAIAMQGLLDSRPHLTNMLRPEFTEIGIGVATDGGRTYFTLLFIG